MRLAALVGSIAVLCAAAAPALAARKPTSVERRAIVAGVQRYWCANLPRDLRPCSAWKLRVEVERVSTKAPGWALAQLDAKGAKDDTQELSTLQNVFVRERAGAWNVTGWFLSLVYPSCPKAAKGTKVPEPALHDLGVCDHLVQTLG